jgi:hypothetical protein
MRHIMWVAVLAGFTMISAAHAQSQAPMNSGSGAYQSNSSGMSSSAGMSPARPGSQAMGENCGTPDEPKPCPPLPKHNLPYYPGDRDRPTR